MNHVDNILAAIILAVEKDIEGDKMGRKWSWFSETHEQRIARMHATKKNSKKKIIKARYKKPEMTEELKAELFQKNRLACIKKFAAWLDGEKSPLKDATNQYTSYRGWYPETYPVDILINLLSDKDLYEKYMKI